MSKAQLKTKPNKRSVRAFLESIKDPQRRKECKTVAAMMKAATGERPTIWGTSIVGFGTYRYKSPRTGREGDWFVTGFASRKGALTLYIMSGFRKHAALMKRLGKYKTGSSCLYLKSLNDVNLTALKELITRSVRMMKR